MIFIPGLLFLVIVDMAIWSSAPTVTLAEVNNDKGKSQCLREADEAEVEYVTRRWGKPEAP